MRNLVILLSSLLLLSGHLFSQATHQGTDFWFGFMDNDIGASDPIELEVHVSASENANVTITDASGEFSQLINVGPNTSDVVIVPMTFLPEIEGKTATALHLTADAEVSVYIVNKRRFNMGAAVVLPTHVLSDEYYVLTHVEPEGDRIEASRESQFLVVATEDNTEIDITPSAETFSGWLPGVTQTITLNAGETYQVKSEGDLTGSHVKVSSESESCSPIAVFGGNKFTNVGGCGGNREHLVEQMIPIHAWGSQFLFVPFRTRIGGDYVKIMAGQDETTINLPIAAQSFTLNAGEWMVFKALDGVQEINADKPIQVAQFARSQFCDDVDSDPFMILLSPLDQRINEAVFDAFEGADVNRYYLNLVAPQEGIENIMLNGESIGAEFSMAGNWAYASLQIPKQTNRISAPNGVIAHAYGFGRFESYGHSAGLRVADQRLSIQANDTELGAGILETCTNLSIALEALPNIPDSFSQFEWDLGDGTSLSGQQIEHAYTEAGAYTVTLTAQRNSEQCGANGLVTFTRNITVTDFEVSEIEGPTSVCPDVTGIVYTVENPASYTYEWFVTGGVISGPSVTSGGVTIDWGPANENAALSVIVRDSDGCMAEKEIAININTQLNPALPEGPSELCGDDFGNVSYTAPFVNGSEYEWFVEGGSLLIGNIGRSVNVAWDGPDTPGRIWYREFNPFITDCAGTSQVLDVTIYPELEVEVATTEVRCFGEATGAASFTVSGGKPGTYRVRQGADEIEGTTLTGLSAGNYTVTVLDELDCNIELNFTINEPAPLNHTLESTDVLCFGEASGTITATPNGGTPPYEYSIDLTNFQDSPEFTNVAAGNYELLIRDANGCLFSSAISIDEPAPLELSLDFLEGDILRASASGGIPAYEYSLDGTTFQASPDFSIEANGTYTITARDANGCTTTANITVVITSVDPPGQTPSIRTYPNPAKEQLIISSLAIGDAISLVDMNGAVLKSVAITRQEEDYALSIMNITERLLLLRIHDREGRLKLVQKVIIRD